MTDEIDAALAAAEEEERVGVFLQYETGNQIGGKPQIIGLPGEVTISGVMEMVAVVERGGLANPANVVNEAEAAIVRLFDVGRNAAEPVDLARDIVAVLAEKGLLRS